MQRAMGGVDTQLREAGLPVLELGIGVHTGEVVVGNIGSKKRAKYGIVGPPVNLVSRIQACTSGGQILCSEDTLREVGDSAEFDERVEIRAKGFPEPVVVFSVCGLRDQPELSISKRAEALVTLAEPLPIRLQVLEAKQIGEIALQGEISKLSHTEAEIRSVTQLGCPFQSPLQEEACPLLRVSRLSELLLFVHPPGTVDGAERIYARVARLLSDHVLRVRFSSLSATARPLLDRLLATEHDRPPLAFREPAPGITEA
jgi:adenylate cyclase